MEAVTEGISGQGMAPESEETKSLKKLRCASKGLKRVKAKSKNDEDEYYEDYDRMLRMLEEDSEAGVIPKNFLESAAPFLFMFVAMLFFYLSVFLLKGCMMQEKLTKLAKTLRWNAVTRFFLIFYLPIMILALMTIRDDNSGTKNALAGEILAYVCFFGLLYFKVYVFYVVLKNQEDILNNPEYA